MTIHDPALSLFTNVHKGVRAALFAACAALGRAGGDAEREQRARDLLAQALRFVAHHGENEDVLLLPLLRERAPEIFARLHADHGELDRARAAVSLDRPVAELYRFACRFTARQLAHMDTEEHDAAAILAVLTAAEVTDFGRRSVERTAPVDQRMMLGWMLPAMTRAHAEEFLGKLPPAVAGELRSLVDQDR